MRLEGKVAIVTGAGRGIGRAIALALASEGTKVVVADINLPQAKEVAQEIEKLGVEALAKRCDVSNSQEAEKVVSEALEKFGKIDILVNNAGINRDALLVRMSESDWDAVINVNLKGTFNFTKAVARVMMRQRSGKIINIASIIGLIGNVGQANYAASKAGIIALTKSAAKELAPRGITVNAIAPGFIETEMTAKLPPETRENFLRQTPLSRAGTPEEVANLVVFLVSDAADYITGQVINIDGGMVM